MRACRHIPTTQIAVERVILPHPILSPFAQTLLLFLPTKFHAYVYVYVYGVSYPTCTRTVVV